MKQWSMMNLSEMRPLSDAEWVRTAPGMSGPLCVWRPFSVWVLVLFITISFSDVDEVGSMLDPFFFHPILSRLPDSCVSDSRIVPFLFEYSDSCNLSLLVCPSQDSSLCEFNFPKMGWQYGAPWLIDKK